MSPSLAVTLIWTSMAAASCWADVAAVQVQVPVPAQTPASTSAPVYVHGEPPLQGLGGALDLITHKGKAFSLRDIQGAPALVFFGFTQCSNTCPLAMAQVKQLLTHFQSRKPPAVVFVTLDPLSDTPSALAQYLAPFDPRIVGLTGSPKQIEQATRRYGVTTQQSQAPLAHSSRWYLLDGRGQLVRVYKIDTPASAMAQDIVRAQSQHLASTLNAKLP